MVATWVPVDVDTYDEDPAPVVQPDQAGHLAGVLSQFARPEWMAEVACATADPAIFFPERGESVEPAKALCATCPAVEPCRAYALELGTEHGIWAGESARKLKRSRAV